MSRGTKEKIEKTAYRMFLEKGYKDTSLRAIADECGIKHSNILYYFNSKEELAKGFFAQYLISLRSEVEDISSRISLRPSITKLTLYWMVHYCFMNEYREFARPYLEIIKENRDFLPTIIPEIVNKDDFMESLLGPVNNLSPQDVIFALDMMVDMDYRITSNILNEKSELHDNLIYLIRLISVMMVSRIPPEHSLERSVDLMLDLVPEESLKNIAKKCME